MKNRNHKNIFKIVVFFLLIIGSIGLINLPQTYSSFQHDESSALVYKTKLYNLYSEHNIILERATMDYIYLRFSFKPSEVGKNSKKDSYKIDIPNTCTFEKVKENAYIDKSLHSYTVSYNNGTNRNTVVNIHIKCAVTPNKELNYKTNVSATIDDQSPFLYTKYTYKETYDDYLKHVYAKVNDFIVISETSKNFDNEFITWIREYGKYITGSEKEAEEYVRKIYHGETELKDPNKFNALPGLSVEYDNYTGEYTFKILENFIGYSKTYHQYKIYGSPDSINLYFSTKTKGGLYQAFQIYLNEYIYPNKKDTADVIYQYAYNDNKLYDLIFNNKLTTGFIRLSYDASTGNSGITLIKSEILSAAMSEVKNKPYIAFDTFDNMMYSFGQGLTKFYSNEISKDIRGQIYNREDIQASITKNRKGATKVGAFNDYFVQKDGNRYLIINIKSDGEINLFTITPVTIPNNDITITFSNTNNSTLTINIKGTNKTSVNQTITNLDKYFKTSTTIGSSNIKSDKDNEYIVEYTVNK